MFNRQTRGGSSHHFSYNPSGGGVVSGVVSGASLSASNNPNGSAMQPVTAILFTSNGSSSSNTLPLNTPTMSSQQQMVLNGSCGGETNIGAISPTNHMNLLAQQM